MAAVGPLSKAFVIAASGPNAYSDALTVPIHDPHIRCEA